jgi:protein-S-isoprenylcysteine O-methyltransferase Ste14
MREGSVTVDRKVRTGRLIGAGRPPTEPIVSLVLVVQGVFGILFALLISVIRRVAIALLGVLFAAGTIAGLLVSVHFGLAGYWSHMNAPWAVTSLVVEGAAIVVLCVGSGLAVRSERAHVRRWRPSGDAEP